MPMSADRADATLEDALRGTATPYVWLHTDDPGPEGVDNVMQTPGEDDVVRKAVAFHAPEAHPENAERRCLADAYVEWTAAEAEPGQFITHASLWSDATGGQPEFIRAIGAEPTPAVGEDGIRIPEGDLEVAITVYV